MGEGHSRHGRSKGRVLHIAIEPKRRSNQQETTASNQAIHLIISSVSQFVKLTNNKYNKPYTHTKKNHTQVYHLPHQVPSSLASFHFSNHSTGQIAL